MSNNEVNIIEKTIKSLDTAKDREYFAIEHFFSDGMYGRMMILEPDSLIVGETHKKGSFGILLEGKVRVISKYGTAIFEAPYIINTLPKDKKVFYAYTKVKYISIHRTDETDLNKLEIELIESSEA